MPHTHPGVFVIKQLRELAVAVGFQAVPAQLLDLVGTSAGVDEYLQGDSGVPTAGGVASSTGFPAGLDVRQVPGQLLHDFRWQRPSLALVFGWARDVTFAEGEVVG